MTNKGKKLNIIMRTEEKQCSMFAKIGHARGHKWMEGKKIKKIEDNVQTDCQMYGYCNFVH